MIKRAIQLPLYGLGLLTLAYGLFFVPLGDRTLFQHLKRIAATDEAQELNREVQDATAQAARSVEEKLRE